MSLLIRGATIIDGVADKPLEGQSLWIEKNRIKAIGGHDDLGVPVGTEVIDGRGKYVIPGLLDANVHLYGAVTLERLARHMDHFEDIIAEAAQVALRGGLTTVFDTWGPRRALINVRERINAGEIPGARIYCAGNIVGFDGPFSADFFPKAPEVASGAFTNRVNAIFVENVGRHLMWLPPERVAEEVRNYIAKGIDFIKFASNEHGAHSGGAFLAFSPQAQAAMVDAAHVAGLTAQAHTTSIEGLRIAVEAGCDLIQHANTTGPIPIPQATLELMARRNTGAVIFPLTQARLEWLMKNVGEREQCMLSSKNLNARNLIRSGAPLLMAWDAMVAPPELSTDPKWGKYYSGADDPQTLGTGHIYWFKAMQELGCRPMEMLKAATRNIAIAYGKDKELGTLEGGKIADLVILDRDPLQTAENYGSIHQVIKDGVVVNRQALPSKPVLTAPMPPATAEEASYVPAMGVRTGLPMCPMCSM